MENQELNSKWNNVIVQRFSELKFYILLVPILILFSIAFVLYSKNSLSVVGYVQIQKDWFYLINSKLSPYPTTIYNLTQIGDCLILLTLLTILIIYTPKLWEALISASLISAIFARVLKTFFLIPRPAQIFDESSFTIVGRRLIGHSSLPSGHSVTIFTILTVLLVAFMPKKPINKFLWISFILITGLSVAFTRTGVGAHHPLDVIVGCTVGSISGFLGIFISRKYKIWAWISNKKYYPIFIILFTACIIVVIAKISIDNLFIYYLSLTSLLFSLYKITHVYLKK